jgi:3-phosphoshikimate 1-carboxyvinyltransferase
MSSRTFSAGPLRGTVTVPGDKSISHRALILAARSPHPIQIRNLNPGRDVRATQRALDAVQPLDCASASSTPEDVIRIDCMNSGSTARMMLGVCAGANLRAHFDGDESLRGRPMEPVAAQLRAFGARIETANGRLPMRIDGRTAPQTRRFILLSPSAQVKSALLFAGVFADTPVTILADKGSRDHTERLLRYFGADISYNRSSVELRSMPQRFSDIDVPGDFSAAAFFIVAAAVAPGSALTILDCSVNPTRTGLLDALLQMGAHITLRNRRERCGEPIADIHVEPAPLRATSVNADLALRMIDEIVVFAVAAAFASGETRITGIQDLRTKESDRIAAIVRLLRAAAIEVEEPPNGILIRGGRPRSGGTPVETHGDHRTAMAAAALAAGAGALRIDDESSIEVSFPAFLPELRKAQE